MTIIEAYNFTILLQKYDQVLLGIVKKAVPNLIAYDICGVQPMTGPTGLIFGLNPVYPSMTVSEAFDRCQGF